MADRAPRPGSLRDATPEDAAEIAEIYNQSIAAGGATMDEEPWTADSVRSRLAGFSQRETILVLESGQRMAGWGIIKQYSDRRGYRFCCETAVYLRRDLVSRGFGTRIKRALIERCRQYGYHHLVAKIFADNWASIEYNKRLGYEVVGTQREIGCRNGGWQDVTILQLILDDVPPEPPRKVHRSGR